MTEYEAKIERLERQVVLYSWCYKIHRSLAFKHHCWLSAKELAQDKIELKLLITKAGGPVEKSVTCDFSYGRMKQCAAFMYDKLDAPSFKLESVIGKGRK